MSRYWNDMSDYAQPDTESLKRKASATSVREKSKGKVLEPVIAKGRNITNTWWGRVWCENLEQYADYASRLDRGKRYVRTGTVIDLKIEKGKVLAKVQGRRKTPYKVEIRISPLSEEQCQNVINRCGNRIDNIEKLLNGDIDEELKEVFTGEDGLFPKPTEISLMCSCPDWAILCKHVAAVLYGIGVRFDENPLLFFKLRGIDVDRFVTVALENKVESMLANTDCVSNRIFDDENDLSIFGL